MGDSRRPPAALRGRASRLAAKGAHRAAFAALFIAPLTAATVAVAAAAVPDFASIASREEAAVVSITTISFAQHRDLGDDDPDEEPSLQASPIDPAPTSPLEGGPWRLPTRGLASGFLVSSDGAILTSAHAVTGVGDPVVRLADGREYRARIVGVDPFSDIALLKVDATGLPSAAIGDAKATAVGDWVVAISAPFGLEASVTAGIVSAKRLLPGSGGIVFLQTDVALNPGSSGSPLFNVRGEVIGVNSMLYTTSGGYMGVSFALPIDVAMRVADKLRADGRVVRGQLGLAVQELTPALAIAFGRKKSNGAVVLRVPPGSPADAAGVRVGDIVVGLDGRDDMPYESIQEAVAERAPGTAVELLVFRGGTLRQVVIRVSAMPQPAAATTGERPSPGGDRLGIVVAAVTGGEGVEVKETYGLALRAGIFPGDRILSINATPVRAAKDYQAALSLLPPEANVALLVSRSGRLRYFALGDKTLP
jgi:serine protease Do